MNAALMDMDYEALLATVEALGEPAYRAKQLQAWLTKGVMPKDMQNLPRTLRERLAVYPWGGAQIARTYHSKIDDTVKYLFQMEDGALVEGVLMRYHHGNTLCLSTQVGCRMGCRFCASTLDGLVRNLRQGEMRGMLAAVESVEPPTKSKRAVTNIVLMGSGEPLDNYEQVLAFLRHVTNKHTHAISPRNISLSTCGLVPEMHRLITDAPHVTLCVSLHAHNDALRDTLVPLNRRYPIRQVLDAANAYVVATGRRVIFEYALIEGVNAADADALALAKLLCGINCHVNLIPLNQVAERAYLGVSRAQAAHFAAILQKNRVSATVRREMGTDIEGACGQLRRRALADKDAPHACPEA